MFKHKRTGEFHQKSKLVFIPLISFLCLFFFQLIPDPRPFSHHVLVMGCEATVRVNACSCLGGWGVGCEDDGGDQ